MQAEFRPPKRRSRIQEEYGGALPVSGRPGESGELRAELINQHVVVCHPEHIKKIHNQVYSSVPPAQFKRAPLFFTSVTALTHYAKVKFVKMKLQLL